MMKLNALSEMAALCKDGLSSLYPEQIKITVGMATCGLAAGADVVYETLNQRIALRELNVVLAKTGCIGACHQEPLVDIRLPGKGRVVYARVTRARARALIDNLSRNILSPDGAWLVIDEEEAIIEDRVESFARAEGLESLTAYSQSSFFARQKKIVLRNSGFIDPTSLAEYVARGGYRALASTFEKTPQQVVDQVVHSGLRGRGGGGFPTGRKWQIAKDTSSETKYLICNGDEGDPGAYMDRTVLEGDPHSVIEGMLIGAYAIGACKGYAYVRDEYPLAIERLSNAIVQAGEFGLLGENIFGSGFNFTIQIVRGAGAFVCGEETAMIASIEGGLGEPNPKPPYPAVSGLWGLPTIINNVKTWATVPVIMARGADWYAALGTKANSGTVVFSLVGQTANTGLVEVPFGMTLRELLEDIGGGADTAPETGVGKSIKAVQTGGPSGGCLPASLFDTPIEYERMKAAGSIMGSGGMVVLDETACMVDIAKYFLDFTTLESCGKCTACREGTKHLQTILTRITNGQGILADLDLLSEVSEMVQVASLCGLGQTAPNPVLSTLRYFREEYETHVTEHRCPTGKCAMIGADNANINN